MPDTAPDPRNELAELETRVLNGDTTVTAAALQKARATAELADLQDEGAQRQAERDRAAQRQAAQDALRSEIDAQAHQLAGVQRAYGEAVAALRSLATASDAWQQARRDLMLRGKPLGMAADVEAMLVDLDERDWVDAARDEAAGRFRRGPIKKFGATRGPIVHHVLRGAAARERIDRDDEADTAARAMRLREREADKQRQRDADREFRDRVRQPADRDR